MHISRLRRLVRRSAFMTTAALSLAAATQPANASLDLFQSWVGAYGLSSDGGGSTGGNYTLTATVPVGATVTAAFLYQSNFFTSEIQPVTFAGVDPVFTHLSVNPGPQLSSARADVTSLVSAVVNGGLSGTYDFTVSDGDAVNGTALVVIYSLSSLPTSTVAILDGFSATTGDATALNFADPLDPTNAGFFAEMRLGIGHSCCNQASTVTVNGTEITTVAGNEDDSGVVANGALITMGGDDDPYSTLLPTYDNDHERYDLTPYVNAGDTSIAIRTLNPSNDDDIFLAAFRVFGRAGVNEPPPPENGVPEPGTWAMMIAGFGLVGASLRARKTALSFAR